MPSDTHAITAHEPVIQKSKWTYEDGELQQQFRKDKEHPDLPQEYFRYECSCGEEFGEWDRAVEHLKSINR